MAVKQTFTGDAKQLNAEIDRMNRKYAQMEQQLARIGEASEKANRAGADGTRDWGDSIDGAVTKIGGMAAAYFGVQQAIQKVNEELERKRELERASATQQEPIAAATVELIRNVGAGEALTSRLEGIEDIRSELEFPDRAALISAATQAVSSSGGLGVPEQLSAVEAATRLSRTAPEDIAPLTGFGLQTMNALGPGTTAEQAFGFLMSAGAQAGIRSTMIQGRNIAPVIATSSEMGGGIQGAREAAALFGVLTQVGMPEEAKTASVGVMRALEGYFGQEGVTDPGTLAGRIQAVQQNQEILAELQGAGGNIPGISAALQATAVGLLTDQEGLRARQFRQFAGAIQVDPSLYQGQVEAIETATPELRGANIAQRQESLRQRMLEDPRLAAAARIDPAYEQLYAEHSITNPIAAAISRGRMWLTGYESREAAAYDVLQYGRGLRADFAQQSVSPRGPGGATVTKEEQERLDRIDLQIDILRDIYRVLQTGVPAAANAQADRHTE